MAGKRTRRTRNARADIPDDEDIDPRQLARVTECADNHSMYDPGYMEWLTLFALLVGPVLAVFVTRFVDARRERHNRRMEIFKTLMRTRRTPMSPEHVGALNLIELEFYKDKAVLAQLREQFQHFGTVHVKRSEEVVDDKTAPEERMARETRFALRLFTERQSLLAKLLHAMAKVLRFKVEQLEIFEGGYTPQGWQDVETDQTVVRRLFADIAEGKRAFPIAVVYFPQQPAETETKSGGEAA